MAAKKKLICFDFETDTKYISNANPLQLAAVAIDPIKLEIMHNSTFNSWIRPDEFNETDYYKNHKDTLDWHCKKQNCTIEVLLEKIKNAPPEKTVWEQFLNYLSNYHDRQNNQNFFSSPAPAGFNIIAFDMPILERLCVKYKNTTKDGGQGIMFSRDVKDLLHVSTLWLEPTGDLTSFSMDSIRDYMGIPKEGGHNALKDVEDTAEILIRFLRLHQNLAPKYKFKNSFVNV